MSGGDDARKKEFGHAILKLFNSNKAGPAKE